MQFCFMIFLEIYLYHGFVYKFSQLQIPAAKVITLQKQRFWPLQEITNVLDSAI